MNIYATSASAADDFAVDHDEIVEAINRMPYSDAFKANNFKTFSIKDLILAELTEAGYNALAFELPPDTPEIITFREKFLARSIPPAPIVQKAIAPTQPAAQTAVRIDESLRSKADQIIKSGQIDSMLTQPFSEIHRFLTEKLQGDAGYQNIRNYCVSRKAVLGI